MMRILFTITNNSLADGIARHILNITSCFAQHPELKIEPAVCIVMPEGDLSRALRSAGVKVYLLNLPNGHSWKVIPKFHQVICDFKPDMIHAHVLALLERIYLAVNRIPVVTTVHGIVMEDLDGVSLRKRSIKAKLEQFLGRLFRPEICKTIYISKGVQEFYHGNRDSVYIYNPIEFTEVAPPKFALHQLLGVGKDTPLIGTACRISTPKNPESFTRVMVQVLQVVPDAHAVVLGTGESRTMDALQQIVSDYGVSDRFHWLGYRSDAPDLMRDLDCFIMTSITEGLPTALLEAISLKTPIAFMDGNGGLKDLAGLHRQSGPIGICVDSGEEEKMAAEIAGMLKLNSGVLLAERAYEVGKKYFSLSAVTSQLKTVYEEVVNR